LSLARSVLLLRYSRIVPGDCSQYTVRGARQPWCPNRSRALREGGRRLSGGQRRGGTTLPPALV